MKKIFPIILMIVSVILICLFLVPRFINNDNNTNNKPINNAINNNVVEKPPVQEILPAITSETSAIFFGDSITAGYLTHGYSWPGYIEDNYEIGHCTNAGVSDYRASTYDDPKKWLVTQVENHYNDGYNYDFVIMQGGINDLLYNTPLGKISDSFDENAFDQNTFIGGLELYISKVTSKWPNARIGYIITYYTPKYTERGLIWTIEDFDKYYDATKEVLDKWHIKYLDLSSNSFTELLDVYERTYLPDFLHPNAEGYKLIYPHIYNFMESLPKYS